MARLRWWEALRWSCDARLVALWRRTGRVGRHDLSRTAALVLASLRDNGPMRITALAAAESVAQPSMTTLVARLERDGLAERGPDATDEEPAGAIALERSAA